MSKFSCSLARLFYRSYSVAPTRTSGLITLSKPAILPYLSKLQYSALKYKSTAAPSSLLADKELATFLTEEIENEQKSLENKGQDAKFDGFDTKLTDAKVVLTRGAPKGETHKIIFNVNNSLDSDMDEYSENADTQNLPERDMQGAPISKPTYTIEIAKNGQNLAFYCSFVEDGGYEDGPKVGGAPDSPSYSDLFRIDELSFYEGEYNDDCYSVSCDLLDEQMYERLFNMLEERGLGNEFASKLADFSTKYEHKLYVHLLSKIKKFIS